MQANAETARDVFAAVDEFLGHLAERRLEPAMACFAQDADIALYGSELSEVLIGPAALRGFLAKLLSRPSGPRFTLPEVRLSSSGNVAWFVTETEVAVGTLRLAPYRLTGILEKRDGRWLWMLFNGSEPLPDRG